MNSNVKKQTLPGSTLFLLVLVMVLLLTFAGLVTYYSLSGGNTDLLSLLHRQTGAELGVEETEPPTTEPLVPVALADGNAASVLCKESYTVSAGAAAADADKTAATAGDYTLSNRELQVYYISEVNAYRAAEQEPAPDFSLPLDCQLCPLGDGNLSWQHYFLARALKTWQTELGMLEGTREPQIIPEEAFQPHEDLHEKYIAEDLPVNGFLYQDLPNYTPNSMHQAYLDGMADQLEMLVKAKGFSDLQDMIRQVYGAGTTAEDMIEAARSFNTAYMYFTEKSFYVEVSDEDAEAYRQAHSAELHADVDDFTVNLRHVLLIPEDAKVAEDGKVTAEDQQWKECREAAEKMLESWRHEYLTNKDLPSNFARLANMNSADEGSRLNGGFYYNIHKGDLISELDDWCFASGRKVGDIAILQSDVGIHIVYLHSFRDTALAAARDALAYEQEQKILADYAGKITVSPDYSAIVLWADTAREAVGLADSLYPDIAHERFPEAMTYLQQDYMYHPYGGSYVGRGGCGITTMAMLTTYMTDEIHSPGMMATDYYYYHDASGTNGDIFRYVPAEMGFYLEKPTPRIEEVIEALQNGQRVISLQVLGHFTRGGHYLLVQAYNEEDDTFQIRDSNVYNYGRLDGHKVDRFTRWQLLSGGSTFWIMQKKITRIPACDRCGLTFEERDPELLLTVDYTCEKCAKALARRNNFLTALNELSAL